MTQATASLSQDGSLGTQRGEYHAFKTELSGNRTTALIGLAFLIGGLFLHYFEVLDIIWVSLGLGGVGLLAFLLGLKGFLTLSRLCVTTYENGLVAQSWGGRVNVPYADVTGLQVAVTTTTVTSQDGSSTSRSGHIHLRRKDGSLVKISPKLEEVDAFLEELTRRVRPHIVRCATEEVSAGRSFDCGALQFTPEGIEAKGRTFTWSPELSVGNWRENVVIREDGEELEIPKDQVINDLFVEEIFEALSPPENDTSIEMNGTVLTKQPELETVLCKEVGKMAQAEGWSQALVCLRFSEELDSVTIVEPVAAKALFPNEEVTRVAQEIATLHYENATGVNLVEMTLGTESGKWSYESTISREA